MTTLRVLESPQANLSVPDFTGHKFQRPLATLALTLTALALWALTHEYRGLVLDGQIYAVQALAKLRPSLNTDLFLQNTTQDQFTIFSSFYAWVIAAIGLNPAAMVLTALFSFWFLCAAWHLTAYLFDRNYAWLAVFLILVTGGHYGAFAVFHFLEPFLTARLPAEALVVTALVLTVRGAAKSGLALAATAGLFHPLVALPGLLLLICLSLPLRVNAIGAACGLVACLAAALSAARVPSIDRLLPPMDGTWLYVVRERSQFLFLQLWTFKDWELNVRPFVCLALSVMTLQDARVRKLALCGMLVGAAGLGVAAIASLAGPAVLIQGQAWRWVWVTGLLSIVFLIPTARALRDQAPCGNACAALLIAAWSFPADIGFFFSLAALTVWMGREARWLQIARNTQMILVLIVVTVIVLAILETSRVLKLPPSIAFSANSGAQSIFTVRVWLMAAVALLYALLRVAKSPVMPLIIASLVGTGAACLLNRAYLQSRSYGSAADIDEFADWRAVIPPDSTVFVTNGHDSGSFVWFTLERNNYLSPGQSAGVVFSRATALEIKRRSEVLVPLVNQSWKILASLQHAEAGSRASPVVYHHALTAKSLAGVCADPALGFVVSPDSVGFDPVVHTRNDAYRNWKLYDCSRVRSLSTPSSTSL